MEVAVLSNREDSNLLASETYRESLARAIALGIRRYTNALTPTTPADYIAVEPLYRND